MKVHLDKYQREAVTTEEKNLLIAAAPGSGKTSVIINRVNYLANIKGVNTYNIIVITFTKAAAINMKERYMTLNSNRKTPFFGTFHSLFYKILRNYIGEINIIENGEAHRVIKKVLLSYIDEINDEKVKEILNSISIFRCNNYKLDEFNSPIDKTVFSECLNTYNEYKKDKNLKDFDDLQLECRRLFIERNDILQGYQRLFKFILVDEFQDCDTLQLDILKLLCKGNSIFAVGDEDQCIYGFRGSKPECMLDFHTNFEGGKKLFLVSNYRSAENIVNLSRELIINNKMRNDKKIVASRKDLKDVKVGYSINEANEADEIAQDIERLWQLSEGCYKDNAVLYRTNVESRSIIDVFIRRKIPFRLLDKEYNFFEHFICKDLIAYLTLSVDSTKRECFVRIINKPFRYISKINIERVNSSRIKEDCFDTLMAIEGIPIFQIKAIGELKKDMHGLNKMSLRSAIDSIIMGIGYIDYLKEYSNKYKLDMKDLEEVLEEFKESSSEFKNIQEFLMHVDEVSREIKNSLTYKKDDYVTLSTIHGVKGMEFKNVFIINCVEDNIPHINNIHKDIEEERRLMYVAITRSINNLFIYIPKTIRGKLREVSRFVKECKLEFKAELKLTYNEGEKVMHKIFGEGIISQIDSSEISIKFKNGVTRRFDSMIVINNKLVEKIG